MTPFTTDPIETLPEWNAVLASGGCCEMPGCPVPTTECESINGYATSWGFWDSVTEKLYSKKVVEDKTYTYFRTTSATAGSGFTYTNFVGSGGGTYQFIEEYQAGAGGLVNADTSVTGCHSSQPVFSFYCAGNSSWTDTSYEYWAISDGMGNTQEGSRIETKSTSEIVHVAGCDFSKTSEYSEYVGGVLDTTEYFEPNTVSNTKPNVGEEFITTTDNPRYEDGVTVAEWEAATRSFLEEKMDFGNLECGPYIEDPSCVAITEISDFNISLKKPRFRWVIPDTFKGSYFKRSWDILTEPDGWDDEEPTVFRSIEEGGTWIWDGPGDPLDPESWKSPWYEIPPPTTPGTRRVVNRRCECYRGPFGSRPEFFGETIATADL